MIDFLDKRSKN